MMIAEDHLVLKFCRWRINLSPDDMMTILEDELLRDVVERLHLPVVLLYLWHVTREYFPTSHTTLLLCNWLRNYLYCAALFSCWLWDCAAVRGSQWPVLLWISRVRGTESPDVVDYKQYWCPTLQCCPVWSDSLKGCGDSVHVHRSRVLAMIITKSVLIRTTDTHSMR